MVNVLCLKYFHSVLFFLPSLISVFLRDDDDDGNCGGGPCCSHRSVLYLSPFDCDDANVGLFCARLDAPACLVAADIACDHP